MREAASKRLKDEEKARQLERTRRPYGNFDVDDATSVNTGIARTLDDTLRTNRAEDERKRARQSRMENVQILSALQTQREEMLDDYLVSSAKL